MIAPNDSESTFNAKIPAAEAKSLPLIDHREGNPNRVRLGIDGRVTEFG